MAWRRRIGCQSRRHGFNPRVGKIPWRGKWQPTLVFLPGESHGRRSLAGHSPWSCKESDTTEQLNNNSKNPRGSWALRQQNSKSGSLMGLVLTARCHPGHQGLSSQLHGEQVLWLMRMQAGWETDHGDQGCMGFESKLP